ncbi:MAG: GNAT family N-acetyltransferase [Caldilineaceae bacterium]|nr:GNAT family N-acetyltransferase [Caldilineaceae bacterium]HRJ43905.1 GNAT family N-acetyltransferase [Caldilineaceae bacterium]
MGTIVYSDSPNPLTPDDVDGLFAHWGTAPTPDAILRIFQGSQLLMLAREGESGPVIGYITAITDGASAAYIPHLEVRAEWQGQGIGSELVRLLLERLRHIYAIDLMCDPEVQPFYERHGFRPWTGMLIRNYDRQACD